MGLKEHKDFLDNMVDSFSAVLNLDLTIIDANPMQRVSGTGQYRTQLPNYEAWNNSYTEQVIRNGKPITVMDASRDTDKTSMFAPYYSVMIYPILSGQAIEGVIVLASFSREQQENLLSNKEQYARYLEKIAALISAKVEQAKLLQEVMNKNQLLKVVTDSAQDGFLLFSVVTNQLLTLTQKAKTMLCYEKKEIYNVLFAMVLEIICLTNERKENVEREIHKVIGGRAFSLVLQAIPVLAENGTVLCIINPFERIQNIIAQNKAGEQQEVDEIVASSRVMMTLKSRVIMAARYASNVLLLGESGTGKELIARMLHARSPRSNYPFITVNCAAIPETLLESELFGYEEGSFTGAKRGGHIGKFMLADKGTLFLDEIGDMPLYMQGKLLRVLSDRKIDRIGGNNPVEVNVRIIAATNRNLEEMIQNKEFREDLFYRLNVIPFNIPPLRERKEDILLLTKHFILKYNQRLGKKIKWLGDEAQQLMVSYNWPGNVRELENSVEYMVCFEEGDYIEVDNVPAKLRNFWSDYERQNTDAALSKTAGGPTLKQQLNNFEYAVMVSAMSRYGGQPNSAQVKEICEELDISESTYYRKIAQYQKEISQF